MSDICAEHAIGLLGEIDNGLGFQMQTYDAWVAAGERIPTPSVH
jgi:hypothetical protein